jgi:hypothetical protein
MRIRDLAVTCPRIALVVLILMAAFSATGAPDSGAVLQTGVGESYHVVAPSASVLASREALTTKRSSPVAHDNEVMALAAQSGRLYAATDQWMYPGNHAYGQVLVKDSAMAPWRVFQQTQVLRVQSLDSFPIPPDQGMGPGHSLLVTQVVVDGRSVIEWLLDGAPAFTAANSFVLPSLQANVRGFGAHEESGVWSIYAGVAPNGILRGTWSKTNHTLLFSSAPELSASSGPAGVQTQKVTGFADCAGAEYVTINTMLYRRNDGTLSPGAARWVPVYREPPVGAHNSGLRGLTCVTHDGAPSLLVSSEGNGDVYRLDGLPSDQTRLIEPVPLAAGATLPGVTKTLEFAPVLALRQLLAASGTTVPAAGRGSIGYVIAAYNNFESVRIGGVTRQLFGIEHSYVGPCPRTRRCGPNAFGVTTFDSAACFGVRTDSGTGIPSYTLRCLSGPSFTPSASPSEPIRNGQAFVAIRTIAPSPFTSGRIYYAGYDCNFDSADGTAWVGSSSSVLHLGADGNADGGTE